VSTTATDGDPCRDHEADLGFGSVSSNRVYRELEALWGLQFDGETDVEVEILDENHDQHLFRLSRVEVVRR
jgi:hypothetical protein